MKHLLYLHVYLVEVNIFVTVGVCAEMYLLFTVCGNIVCNIVCILFAVTTSVAPYV